MSDGNQHGMNIGDVIICSDFSYAHYANDYDKQTKEIADKHLIKYNEDMSRDKSTTYISEVRFDEDERLAMTANSGKIAPKIIQIDISAYDKSRGESPFVIEAYGYYLGHGREPWDRYSYGTFAARRLDKSGIYKVNAELIYFRTNECSELFNSGKLKVIKKMQIMFVEL